MSRVIEELRKLCRAAPSTTALERQLTATSGLPIHYKTNAAADIKQFNARLAPFIGTENLPELAEICRQAANDKQRLSNGRSASEIALDTLLAPFHQADGPEQCEEALAPYEAWWQQDRGNPAAAGIYAQALALTGYAYRGDAWASDVSQSQWIMLRDYVNRAQAVIERASPDRAGSWIWNRSNFQVSFVAFGVNEATRQEVTSTFDATRRLDHLEVSLYEDRVVQLLPRWGGSYDALEQLARQSYALTHLQLGAEMYARIYDCVIRYEHPNDTLLDYHLLKDGFWDWLHRVPSQPLANRFAAHAHAAHDVTTLTRIFKELITEIHPQHWFELRQPMMAWNTVSTTHAARH